MERKLFATTIGIILLVCSISYKFSDKNAVFMKLVVEQNMLFLDQNYRPYFREKKMLTDQRGIAEFIRNNVSPNEKISGFKWLNSPEIAYLSGHKIYNDPEQVDITYVISSIYDRFLDPDAESLLQTLPLEKVYFNDNYTLYKKTATLFSIKL